MDGHGSTVPKMERFGDCFFLRTICLLLKSLKVNSISLVAKNELYALNDSTFWIFELYGSIIGQRKLGPHGSRTKIIWMDIFCRGPHGISSFAGSKERFRVPWSTRNSKIWIHGRFCFIALSHLNPFCLKKWDDRDSSVWPIPIYID